jgi:Zn-dependent protease
LFLAEPRPTQFDLNFEIFGTHVRVHPLFWLVSAILGFRGVNASDAAIGILIWIVAVFISILIHEMGHVLAMRYYGERARVVLYSFGGLAIPDVSPYSFGYGRGRSPLQQVVISAAGPAAGFILAAVIVGVTILLGVRVALVMAFGFVPFPLVFITNPYLQMLVADMLWVNIFWGLLNLMPVYPLDGGQISRELFLVNNPRGGIQQSLWLSVFTAAGLAGASLYSLQADGLFMAIMFGSLAFGSWQMLQQISGRGGGFGGGNPW